MSDYGLVVIGGGEAGISAALNKFGQRIPA